MVLSNKKLKQKLRAEITESLTSSATGPDDNESANPEPGSQTQSLKQLLDSLTQKPRLSKREKKRRTGPVLETLNNKRGGGDGDDKKTSVEEERNEEQEESKNFDVVGRENGDKKKGKKKEKKRKREEGESGELGEGKSGELDEGESGGVKEAKKAKTTKKKKKKQKKNKKKVEQEEEDNKNEVLNNGNDSQVNNDNVSTKVYVGGIPYSSTDNDIKRYFESCGTIDEIDCMTFPDSGRFRGIAIITFRTEGAAKRALALDGSEMDGLLLKIQPCRATTRVNKTSDFAPRMVEGYNRIYLGNLSWDITEEDVRKLFSDCKIESIRFGMDKETGDFKGYAHVDFSDSLSLTLALKLDQEIVCGRPVKISCAVPRKGGKNQSISVPTQSISVPTSNVVSSTDTDNAGSAAVSSGSAAVSGKIRRRTCYECGEKGHLSSACPKKAADPTNSNTS